MKTEAQGKAACTVGTCSLYLLLPCGVQHDDGRAAPSTPHGGVKSVPRVCSVQMAL
jgi:hypothetical protein